MYRSPKPIIDDSPSSSTISWSPQLPTPKGKAAQHDCQLETIAKSLTMFDVESPINPKIKVQDDTQARPTRPPAQLLSFLINPKINGAQARPKRSLSRQLSLSGTPPPQRGVGVGCELSPEAVRSKGRRSGRDRGGNPPAYFTPPTKRATSTTPPGPTPKRRKQQQ